MSGNWLKRIALVCMTPEVDAREHSEALPSYGIHRIQAAIVANPAFANTEVRIIDLGSEDDDAYLQELLRFRPQLIGYSLFVWSTNCLVKVARNIRKLDPSIVQVFGGPSARSALLDLTPYAPAYEYADCLVIRDGEEAFNQIAMSLDELQDRTRTIKAMERTLEEEKFDVHIAEMTRFAHVAIEIIMGLPGDTPETFRKTFWRARRYPCTLRVYHCVVLPSALMVRSPPEHLLNYDPSSLKMRSCLGWTAEAIEQECRFLSTLAEQSGGAIGEFLWVFPPP